MKQPISIAELQARVDRLLEEIAKAAGSNKLPELMRQLDNAKSQLYARRQIGQ